MAMNTVDDLRKALRSKDKYQTTDDLRRGLAEQSERATVSPAPSAPEKTKPTLLDRVQGNLSQGKLTLPSSSKLASSPIGMDRETWKASPGGIKVQSEAMPAKIDAAKMELLAEQAKKPQGAGYEYYNPAEYAAERKVKELTAKQGDLAAQYYQADSASKLDALKKQPGDYTRYADAKTKRADMEKLARAQEEAVAADYLYLQGKYGVEPGDKDGYYNLLMRLQRELDGEIKALGARGVDFDRLTRYEDKLAGDAFQAQAARDFGQFANKHPVLASGASVLASPFQGLDALPNLLNYSGKSDPSKLDSYEPMSTADFPISNYVSATRGAISKGIEDSTSLKIGKQNVASFLYQTGMSIGDSALQVGTLGGGAALFMGASAATNQARDIVSRGGSNEQAFWGGLAAGAAETIFEKVSIESLLKVKDVTGWKRLLTETAKQAGVEASEEMFTEIANILSDAAIMGEQSNFKLAVRDYMAQGMTEEDAKRWAYLDNIASVAWAGAGGALSGGAMGGATNLASYVGNARTGAELRGMGQDVSQAVIDEGLLSNPATESYQQAEDMRRRQEAGKKVSDAALGGLYRANVEAVGAETDRQGGPASPVAGAATAAMPTGMPRLSRGAVEAENAAYAAFVNGQVQRGEAIGPHGKRAFQAAIDVDSDLNDYYKGFMSYYNAGVSGQELDKVSSKHGAGLSSPQRFAAWVSGRNDAAASLAGEREKAKLVTVYSEGGGLVRSEAAEGMDTNTADLVDRMGKALGVKVVVDATISSPDGRASGANGYYRDGVIHIAADAGNPTLVVMKHEVTHRMQALSPESYRRFRDYAVRLAGTDTVQQMQEARLRSGESLSNEAAMDEIAANLTERLMTDRESIDRFIRDDRNAAQRFFDTLKKLVQTVKEKLGRAEPTLEQAERLWKDAFKAAEREAGKGQKNTAQEGGGTKHSLDPDFAAQFDQWMAGTTPSQRRASPGYFQIGTTSEALKSIGMDDYRIFFGKSKLEKIMEKHPAMNAEVMKSIPDVLEHPILVMQSQTVVNRVTLFGEAMDADGKPVLVALELSPQNKRGEVLDFAVIASAYGKDNAQNLIDSSHILYVEPNKNRTDSWLRLLGLQLPSRVTSYGSIDSISFVKRDVNGNLSFGEAGGNTAMREAFEHAEKRSLATTPGGASPGPQTSETLSGTAPNHSISTDEMESNTKFSLKEYSKQERMEHAKTALEHFGQTHKWAETGYILLDGKRLDFSGRHDGATGGDRTVDHRDISDALGLDYGGEDYSGAMVQFMGEGNIRIMPESNGINLSVLPTKAQFEILDDFITKARGEVILDIDAPGGDTVSSTEYPKGTRVSKVLADIRQYFETGAQPYVSEVSQFRYSLKTDSEGHQLTEGQAEFFTDSKVLDERGNLLVVYHGTNAEFTKFAIGDVGYHLGTKEQAERRIHNAGKLMRLYANIQNPLELEADYGDWGGNNLANTLLDNDYFESDEISTRLTEILEIDRAANGKSASKRKDIAMRELLQNMGYDGIRYANQFEGDGYSYIAFYPEQIKHVDNKTPTADPDIRYSLKDQSPEARAARLEELNEYLRAQLKVTVGAVTDKKAVAGLARALLSEYSSDYDHGALSQNLQALYDRLAGGDVTWEGVRAEAQAIAEEILGGSLVRNDDSYQNYEALRKYARGTQIHVPGTLWSELERAGGYNEFRKANMGRLNLSSKGGMPIDTVYKELSAQYPEFFDENEQAHPADQLMRLADVLEELRPVMENPYSGNMKEASAYLAADIIERFYETPQQAPTYADRQEQKMTRQKIHADKKLDRLRQQKNERIEAIRRQGKERVAEVVTRERERRVEQVQNLTDRFKSKEAAGRERRSARELRRKIGKHAKELSQQLLRPSDKKHIPEELRSPVAALLEAINLESAYAVDVETGKRTKNGDGLPTRRTEAFRALRDAYRKALQSGEGLVLDPDLLGDDVTLGNLDAVIEMKATRIADMSRSQLETVWNTVRAIEASISSANKTLAKSRYETISETAEAMKSDFIMTKPFQERYGARGMLHKLVNVDMLSPVDYFKELGRAGEAMWDELRQGLDQKVRDTKAVSDYAADLMGETDVRKWSGNKAQMQTFHTSGGDIQLTPAQVMSLYLLMKRKQAHEHILLGGIRQAPVQAGGKIVKSYAPVHVALGDVATIVESLTDEQRRIADGLGKFMSTTLSDWGNEVSMGMYGYKKFVEENYFPIKSDANYTKTEFAAGQDQRVKNMGFTKSTVPHANNAVMIEDVFEVFTGHADDMSTYHAFAAALEDVERVYNFRYRTEDGAVTGSVSQTIERVLGRDGKGYFRQLMKNINEGIRTDVGAEIPRALLSNYKAAAVGANLRVVVQQPTAIFRAGAMIDPKYLVAGMAKKGNFGLVKTWAPIAQWKDWGYFQLDTGRQMKDIMLGTDSTVDKVRELAMKPAGWADNITWSRLWNAVELEVADKRPDLERGSDAFYKAVAERFGEVVDRTQVVDSVLHRSQTMRSGNTLVQMAASFMAEPTKTYNLFRTAAREALTSGTKESRKKLARVTVTLLVTGAATAAAAALVDALRDDDDDETYRKKFLQAFIGLDGDEETLGDYVGGILSGNIGDNLNPLGMVPYGKDILSIWQGYDVDRMDMTAIKDLKDAADRWLKAVSGDGSLTVSYATMDLIGRAAKLLGLPLANVKRDLEALVNGSFMAIEAFGGNINGARFSWAQRKTPINDKNKNIWIDMGYRFERDGDSQTAGRIYDALTGAGIPAEKIEERKRNVLKKTDEFADRKEEVRSGVSSDLKGSRGFGQLTGEQQEKVMDSAETYAYVTAMMEQNPDYTVPDNYNWVLKANAGERVGLEPWEYILFDLAYSMAESEKDADGKTVAGSKQEKVIDALDDMGWLTNRERDYLYGTRYTSDKNNPYK